MAQQDGKAYILKLPLEILNNIFELAVHNGECYDFHTTNSLTLTCQAFSTIATPFLYKTIKLKVPGEYNSYTSLTNLTTVLQRSPSLAQHCKDLWFELTETETHASPLAYSAVDSVVRQLRNMRSLRIFDSCNSNYYRYHISSKYMWKLIDTVMLHIPRLEELYLNPESRGIEIGDLFEIINIPSLKHLSLEKFILTDNADSDTKVLTLSPPKKLITLSKKAYANALIKNGTALFASLAILDTRTDPKCLEKLILWPKTLVSFCYRNDGDVCPAIIQTLQFTLSTHRESLETIDIYGFPGGRVELIFSNICYPKLEFLSLSPMSFRNSKHWFISTDASWIVRAPNLKVLVLDFGKHSRYGRDGYPLFYYANFKDEEEELVRQLADKAINGKVPLQKIQLLYNPLKDDMGQMDVYPWDRMDRLKEEFRSLGLILEYDKPEVSRQEFLDFVQLQKFYEETTMDDDMVVAQSPDRLW